MWASTEVPEKDNSFDDFLSALHQKNRKLLMILAVNMMLFFIVVTVLVSLIVAKTDKEPLQVPGYSVCSTNSDCNGNLQKCFFPICMTSCQLYDACIHSEYCDVSFGGVCVPTVLRRRYTSSCSSDKHCLRSEKCLSGKCENARLCARNNECDATEQCADGLCKARPACKTDADCSNTDFCTDGFCRAKWMPCEIGSQCYRGEKCHDGYCRKSCHSNEQCGRDSLCQLHAKVCVESSADTKECIKSEDCPKGRICWVGACLDSGLLLASCQAVCKPHQICFLGSCIDSTTNPQDSRHADAPLVQSQCFSNADCPPSTACINGRCVTYGRSCRTTCTDSQYCIDDTCHDRDTAPQTSCVQQSDCYADQRCIQGTCENPSKVFLLRLCSDAAQHCFPGEDCVNRRCERTNPSACSIDPKCAKRGLCSGGECGEKASLDALCECPNGYLCAHVFCASLLSSKQSILPETESNLESRMRQTLTELIDQLISEEKNNILQAYLKIAEERLELRSHSSTSPADNAKLSYPTRFAEASRVVTTLAPQGIDGRVTAGLGAESEHEIEGFSETEKKLEIPRGSQFDMLLEGFEKAIAPESNREKFLDREANVVQMKSVANSDTPLGDATLSTGTQVLPSHRPMAILMERLSGPDLFLEETKKIPDKPRSSTGVGRLDSYPESSTKGRLLCLTDFDCENGKCSQGRCMQFRGRGIIQNKQSWQGNVQKPSKRADCGRHDDCGQHGVCENNLCVELEASGVEVATDNGAAACRNDDDCRVPVSFCDFGKCRPGIGYVSSPWRK